MNGQLDPSTWENLREGPCSLSSGFRIDRVGSATARVPLTPPLKVRTRTAGRSGDVVLVRVLTERSHYNLLEAPDGSWSEIKIGDLIIGVLGGRRALKGYVGYVPTELRKHCMLQILNLGGVIGCWDGGLDDLGPPIDVEYLGHVTDDEDVLNLASFALSARKPSGVPLPIVAVAGTCMDSGKTVVANAIIRGFSDRGTRVTAGKLAGVACLRDTLAMKKSGAIEALSFLDYGIPSTADVNDLSDIVSSMVAELEGKRCDALVVELGDGILGGYHVDSILRSSLLQRRISALIFCAGDLVGAWGGIQLLRQHGFTITAISGAVTDSSMGCQYIENNFGVPAANARHSATRLLSLVEGSINQWHR